MAIGTYNYGRRIDGDSLGLINWNFFINDTDTVENLTGATPKIVWRRGSLRGKVVQILEVGSGLNWTDQANGQLRQDSFIANWGVGTYWYDLQITYPDGSIYTKVQGNMRITAQSTT